jgi:hypothetical protein
MHPSVYPNAPFSTLPAVEPGSFQTTLEPWRGANALDALSHQSHPKVEFRIPSDQLQKLLAALDHRAQQKTEADAQSMPPPPLPSTTPGLGEIAKADHKSPSVKDEAAQDIVGAATMSNRRGESHSNLSDISMHTECTGFPACTTEDFNGGIIHSSRGLPAEVIRSRKEGGREPTSEWKHEPIFESTDVDRIRSGFLVEHLELLDRAE